LALTVVGRLGMSDHYRNLAEIEVDMCTQVNEKITRNWSRANYDGMRREMGTYDLNAVLDTGNAEEA
jgi:hypothetical protein